MANVDENVQVGVELTTTSLRLGAKALIAVFNFFLNLGKDDKNYQDLTTKQGQQKVKELFEKNQNNGIESLGENVSKKEIDNVSKELKSMGVDFSVKKIGKDNYSLFFAGKDREAIETGMKNSIEKYALKETRKEKLKESLKPKFSIKDLKQKDSEKKQEKKNTKKQEKVRKNENKKTR